MSMDGGLPAETAIHAGGCEVIRLRDIMPPKPPRRRKTSFGGVIHLPLQDVTGPALTAAAASLPGLKPAAVMLAVLVAAGQTAALPILHFTGGTSPWLLGAFFGAGAVLSGWGAGLMVRATASGTQEPNAAVEPVLNDAFTLALLLAAAGLIGGIGGALLLSCAAVLSRAVRRVAATRSFDDKTALLVFIALIALAGLCRHSDWRGWLASGAVLTVASVAKGLRAGSSGALWRQWGATSLLCASVAAIEIEHGGGMWPAATPAVLALLAGLVYGISAEVCVRKFSPATARFISSAIPFLAAAVAVALGDSLQLEQIAAALLLACTLAAANSYSVPSGADTLATDPTIPWPRGG